MIFRACTFLVVIFMVFGCGAARHPESDPVQVAFIADAHFADVFSNFDDQYFEAPTSVNGKNSLVRTMEAQLHSTRLFNENYFALIAALEDVVGRGIKLVALPGDFSDDGQPLHIRGLRTLLDGYANDHGISFFMISGNHDPTRPMGKAGGKRDFLGADGRTQPIMGREGMYRSDPGFENPTLILADLEEWGYSDIAGELGNFGFHPKPDYHYWATPFSGHTFEDYTLEKAKEASQMRNRTFLLDGHPIPMPDVSYVVEPTDGLWLLALDANVHVPNKNGTGHSGAGIGYNEVLKHKKHLIGWAQKVVEQADRLGKTLIAFSHYPMLDFNDGASQDMVELFGPRAFQAYRVPNGAVGKAFADIGLKVHVAGHMHLNDTGVLTTENGNTLINIQSPSLAAYMPAYKIITIKDPKHFDVETVVLDSVPGYRTFFALYEKELEFLRLNFPDRNWNGQILASTSYAEYTKVHLGELIRLRFLANDWPKDLSQFLSNLNGWELLVLSKLERDLSQMEKESIHSGKMVVEHFEFDPGTLERAMDRAGLDKSCFTNWDGEDLIFDFYRFKNADGLALGEIERIRLDSYRFLFKALLENDKNGTIGPLIQFAGIFQKQISGEPAVNFSIDLEKGELKKK